jgi:hypothetical protein
MNVIGQNFMKKLLLLLFIYSISGYAQSANGIITGVVTELLTGKPVPFANVTIEGTTLGNATDDRGHYTITAIPPGSWQVKASAIGYASIKKTDVTVNNSKPTQLDFALREEAFRLANVVITADNFSKDNFEATSVSSFSYEEIRRAPGGFEDVVRALSVLPGVAQADAGRNDLIVRGGAPSENLYIVNGFEIPNINHFGSQGATGGPLSFINLDFVKDATFSTGGFPVLYGDKLSSVLRINLRNGRTDKIGGKATISATQFGFNLEGPVSPTSSFLFSARRSYLDFIFKAAGFGFVPEYYDFLAKYDYEPDAKNLLSVFAISALDNVRYFNTTADQKYDNSKILGSNQKIYTVGISYRRLLDNGYVRILFNRNSTDYNSEQRDSLLRPIFLNKSLEADNKLKVEYVHRFSNALEATAGGAVDFIQFDSNLKLPVFIDAFGNSLPFVTTFGETLPNDSVSYKHPFLKYGIYAALSLRLSDQLQAGGGIRADYFDIINNKFSVSPRVNLTYSVNDLLSFSGSAGYYRQNPSYIWMAYNNFNLDPALVKQYVLGSEFRVRADALLKLEIYRKDYSSYPSSKLRPYLTLANTGAGFSDGAEDNFSSYGLEPLISDGSGRSQGIEFSAQKRLSEIPCYGLLSVTWNTAKFTALDGIQRDGTYDQRWILNISGGYLFDQSWEVSTKFRFATGRPYTPFNADGTQSIAKYNSERLPDFHTLDVRVDKRWFYEHYTLITYIDLQNIYSRKNLSGYRWNSREHKIEEQSSIGLLPSIGISLEF